MNNNEEKISNLMKLWEEKEIKEIERREKECKELLEQLQLYRVTLLDENSNERKEKKQKYNSIINRLNAKKYPSRRLTHWFSCDTWTVYEGLLLINGFDPRSVFFDNKGNIFHPSQKYRYDENLEKDIKTPLKDAEYPYLHLISLDGLNFRDEELDDILKNINETTKSKKRDDVALRQENALRKYYNSLKFWNSGNHDDDIYEPEYFINWALEKNYKIPWLDWAVENGYYDINNNNNNEKDKELNPKSETAHLHIIGALFFMLKNEMKKTDKDITQTKIIEKMASEYSGFSGVSESNLKIKMPKAISAIEKPS